MLPGRLLPFAVCDTTRPRHCGPEQVCYNDIASHTPFPFEQYRREFLS